MAKRSLSREWKTLKNNPLRLAKHREGSAAYKVKVKVETLSHYGPDGNLKCSWPGCGVDDIDVLSLDHVVGGGNEDRRASNCAGGTAQYVKLRKLGYPDGFQTLCMNHQFKKDILQRRELSNEQITALREGSTTKTFDGCGGSS